MEKNVEINDMLLLLDNYSVESRSLHESLKQAGYDCPAAVIEDDGFLPGDCLSAYGFFLGDFKKERGEAARPRYFNEITAPDYWEISGDNKSGKVQDLDRDRGKIFYAEPAHRRLVKAVDWYDERGIVRFSDHYNRYGGLYARTAFDAKGKRVNKSYFSAAGREVIVENYITGDIILNEAEEVKFFRSKTDFVLYFLERAGFQKSRLFFNSLSTPFFVSQRLDPQAKRDVLFWQEPEREDIPGNMQIILNGKASRAARIMVQKRKSYEKLIALGARKDMVHRLGFIYSFERENGHKPEALICTNSDQIEHLERIVKALPEMNFHIAALTEMSSKLTGMGLYANVNLYPNVKMKVLEELFKKCDYYLDINHQSEIVSAVRRAFLNHQLIFAFQETVHNRDFIAGEHIYSSDHAGQMISDIRNIMADANLLERHLRSQKEAAMAEDVNIYRKMCM